MSCKELAKKLIDQILDSKMHYIVDLPHTPFDRHIERMV